MNPRSKTEVGRTLRAFVVELLDLRRARHGLFLCRPAFSRGLVNAVDD